MRVRDEFERLAELGRGATGAVYAARERSTGRMVAVKALLAPDARPDARARFLREGRVRIDSPHVVQVLDIRDEDGQLYLIQELVRGTALDTLVAARGALPVPEALRLAEGVARGLAAAHAAGVVHRDVKPANVLVDEQGVVRLADFGLAKLVDGASLTRTGEGMGTLAYVAPEQAQDAKRASPASDLYSLGATLYTLLSGRPPYKPGINILVRIFTQDPEPLGPEIPPRVAALVRHLMQRDPDDRPHDANHAVKLIVAARAELPP
jgi:eukaryotic-like serine/threonine-protein kinase